MPLFRKRGAALRPPLADLTSDLELDGLVLPLAEVAVGARVDAGRLSVEVHHSSFAVMAEEQRHAVAVELLVAALGEKGLRQVVHQLRGTGHPPIDSFGLESLRAFARSLGADVDPPA